MAQKKGHGSLHPWPFALAQSYAWVQVPKEKKAKEERGYPHRANIKKQSKFFVKGKIEFRRRRQARPAGLIRHIH